MRSLASKAMLGTLGLVLLQSNAAAKSDSVVLAPISSVSGTKSKALTKIEKTIKAGFAKVPQLKVVGAKAAASQANKAKRPELRSCDGEIRCLSQLGKLMAVKYAVSAEVGGLGTAQVVYLKVVDVNTAKEVRSTLIELTGTDDTSKAEAAAIRLLAPDKYVGSLIIKTKIEGAIIYLDGQKRGTTPTKPISSQVGSHALRVTHPEHRDYVRFVDVNYGDESIIEAELQALPSHSKELSLKGQLGNNGANTVTQTNKQYPWYYRWYSVAGGTTLVFVGSVLLVGALHDGISVDQIRDLSDL